MTNRAAPREGINAELQRPALTETGGRIGPRFDHLAV